MDVRPGQHFSTRFSTCNRHGGVADFESPPSGTLIVDGIDTSATVTITRVDTGDYRAQVAFPSHLRPGQTWQLKVDGNLDGVRARGIVEKGAIVSDRPNIVSAGTPCWDTSRSELSFQGQCIRRVRPMAKWIPILNAFQEEHWPSRIDNPLPPAVDLSQALYQLNKGLHMIRFERDGTGEGIVWRHLEAKVS